MEGPKQKREEQKQKRGEQKQKREEQRQKREEQRQKKGEMLERGERQKWERSRRRRRVRRGTEMHGCVATRDRKGSMYKHLHERVIDGDDKDIVGLLFQPLVVDVAGDVSLGACWACRTVAR